MASSRTPIPGAVETSSSGNSGNPSTSLKLSNVSAVEVRGARSFQSVKFESRVETNIVQASGTSVAQPPGQNNSIASNQNVISGDLSVDRYRRSDDPGRSPSRQLDELEDKPASISVKAFDGAEVLSAYSSFFLQSVSESEQEKYQVVETFTAYYTFFFGKRPPIYTFSGILLNDPDHNWMNTFRFLYEKYFRGTAAAEFGAQAIVNYDKRVVSGYLLNLNVNQDAMTDKGVPFSFSMLVVTHDLIGYSSDFENFITTQQNRLRELRLSAAADIAALNKNPDGLQTILKQNVLRGQTPAASAKKAGETNVERPAGDKKSSIAGANQITPAQLIKNTNTGDNIYGGNDSTNSNK